MVSIDFGSNISFFLNLQFWWGQIEFQDLFMKLGGLGANLALRMKSTWKIEQTLRRWVEDLIRHVFSDAGRKGRFGRLRKTESIGRPLTCCGRVSFETSSFKRNERSLGSVWFICQKWSATWLRRRRKTLIPFVDTPYFSPCPFRSTNSHSHFTLPSKCERKHRSTTFREAPLHSLPPKFGVCSVV